MPARRDDGSVWAQTHTPPLPGPSHANRPALRRRPQYQAQMREQRAHSDRLLEEARKEMEEVRRAKDEEVASLREAHARAAREAAAKHEREMEEEAEKAAMIRCVERDGMGVGSTRICGAGRVFRGTGSGAGCLDSRSLPCFSLASVTCVFLSSYTYVSLASHLHLCAPFHPGARRPSGTRPW